MNTRARQKVLDILKQHRPPPLDEMLVKELQKIVSRAAAEAGQPLTS